MSTVQEIQAEIKKLSPEELNQVREWLENLVEDQREFTDEFKGTIEQSKREIQAGVYSRVRRP